MAELSPRPDGTPASVDPHAVRVRVAPESHTGDEPSIRISPEPGPLRMSNPTVGTGPLGGIAIPDEPAEPPAVSAQRHILVDDEPMEVVLRPLGGPRYLVERDGIRSRVIVDDGGPAAGVRRCEVLVDGFRFLVEVESERVAALRERASRGRASSAHAGPLQVKAIIPGKVVAVSVAPGDAVTAGQQLLVVEAMKMQNELRAPRDGTIERVGVAVGVNIEIGDLLVVIS